MQRQTTAPILLLGSIVCMTWVLLPYNFVGEFFPDDTYYVLTIAREWSTTGSPSFEGIPNSGFQPLFVILLTAIAWLCDLAASTDIASLKLFARTSLALSAVFHVAGAAIVIPVLRRLAGEPAAWIFAAFWFLDPTFLMNGMNGLETSLAMLMLLATWRFGLRNHAMTCSTKALVGHGTLLGLAYLSRVDLILMGVYYAGLFLRELARGHDRSDWIRRCTVIVGTMGVTISPWLLYIYTQTGQLLPGSGGAVRQIALTTFMGGQWSVAGAVDNMATGLAVATVMGLGVMIPLFFLAYGAWREGRLAQHVAPLALPLTFAGAIFVFYTWYLPAGYFFLRYLHPVAIALLLALAILGGRAWSRSMLAPVILGVWFVAATTTGFQPLWDSPLFPRVGWGNMYTYYNYDEYYERPGLWAREHVPAGQRLGTTQAGSVAFFATDLHVVNLDGVVNPHIAAAIRRNEVDTAIREEQLDILVDTPANLRFLDLRSQQPVRRMLGKPVPLGPRYEGYYAYEIQH